MGTAMTEAAVAETVEALARRNDAHIPAERDLTYYDSQKIPPVPLVVILQRWAEYVPEAEAAMVAAAVYLERFAMGRPLGVHSHTMHRLVIAALVIGVKYASDFVASDDYLSQVTGVSTTELRRLQVQFLKDIDFALYISSETCARVMDALQDKRVRKAHSTGGAAAEIAANGLATPRAAADAVRA